MVRLLHCRLPDTLPMTDLLLALIDEAHDHRSAGRCVSGAGGGAPESPAPMS